MLWKNKYQNETMKTKTTDVAIIGAGILGCSMAYELTKRGKNVLVIEAGVVGQGTSSKNFSWLNATSKTNDAAYHWLNAQSLDIYKTMAQQWGSQIGLHASGMLEWRHQSDVIGVRALQITAEKLASLAYSYERLEIDRFKKVEPDIKLEQDSIAYQAKHDCWLDVPVFLEFLVRQIQLSGGEIIEHCQASTLLADDDGKILGLITAQGQINCQQVVVATGAQTPDVLSQLTGYEGFASHFPMQQAPGLLVSTPPISSINIEHILYPPDSGGLHIRPTPEGGLLIGSDDADGMVLESQTEQTKMLAAKVILERTKGFIPEFAGEKLIAQCQLAIGIRAVPADELSIVGPMLSAEGLYILLTHSGITLAPKLATLLADCIERGEVPEQLRPFGIDRFGFAA